MLNPIWMHVKQFVRNHRSMVQTSLNVICVAVLVVGSSALLINPVIARRGKAVRLVYENVSATVSLRDLQDLADTGEISEELQNYFDAIPIEAEDGGVILNEQIYDGGIPIGQKDVEFLAIQIARTLGDRLGRERLDDMVDALELSFADDRTITLLEIVEHYPDSTVRVDLKRLDQLRTDLILFVERISPVLAVVEELLPELVCDCGFEDANAMLFDSSVLATSSLTPSGDMITPSPVVASSKNAEHIVNNQSCAAPDDTHADQNYQIAITQLKSIVEQDLNSDRSDGKVDDVTSTNTALQSETLVAQEPLIPLALDGVSRIPDPISENIIISVGPIRPSFAVSDLTYFADTGIMPNGWRFYLNVAGITAEEFRTALTAEVDVDLMFMDDWLNNILGEYLLFQAGQIIHNPSRDSNIQALRSALILSAADDGKLSLLEFVRNYPSTNVVIEALNLARFGNNLKRQGLVGTATAGLEDMLLELQAGVADDICHCEGNE